MLRGFFILMVVLLMMSNRAICQNSICNDSITFKVLRKSLAIADDGTVIPSSFFVNVNIGKARLKELKALSRTEWLNLLSNDKTDWAANLILYNLTGKDGIIFSYSAIKNRAEWIESGNYTKDILYWRQHLK